MKVAYSRVLLFVAGLLTLGWAILPAAVGRVAAAPALVITATSTAEPPTLTTVPTTAVPTTPVTTVPTTAVPTTPVTTVPTTAVPTSTPTAGPSVTPTRTPDDPGPGPDPDPDPDPSDTPQASATATPEGPPAGTPESTPVGTPAGTPAVTPTPSLFADPVITKSASRTTLSVGETVEFTLSVTNRGNAAASDVVVEDTLPAFLALDGVSASRGEVSVSGATVRVVIGTLDPGETVTVRITARVVALTSPPDNANVGTVSTSSDTDDPANNSSRVDLTTVPPTAPSAPATGSPAALPNTGDPGSSGAAPLAALGLALIAASLLLRSRRG